MLGANNTESNVSTSLTNNTTTASINNNNNNNSYLGYPSFNNSNLETSFSNLSFASSATNTNNHNVSEQPNNNTSTAKLHHRHLNINTNDLGNNNNISQSLLNTSTIPTPNTAVTFDYWVSPQARIVNNNTTNNNDNNEANADSKQLEMALKLKDTQIELLETEIQNLKTLFNQKYNNNPSNTANVMEDSIEVPANLEMLLNNLSTTLQERETELKDTKEKLESVLTAIALNPSNTVTKNGRYDEETMAHKIVTRLDMLTKENQEMAKMLSYGRSKELHIELELLKKENKELKARLEDLNI